MTDIHDAIDAIDRPAHGVEAYFMGLDIGRAQDPSALSLNARVWRTPQGGPDRDVQKYSAFYHTLLLNRFPLQTPYEQIEDACEAVYHAAPLRGQRVYFVADQTGVGDPVVLSMRRKGVAVVGIKITSGHDASQPALDQYNVSKAALVTSLVKVVQTYRLLIDEHLPALHMFYDELNQFGYKVNPDTGNLTYEALDAQVHDDLVIAQALPLWYGETVVRASIPGRKRSYVEEDTYNPLRS